MPLQDQQQLRPLGEMPGLVAPGTEDVGLVVLVVVPVHRPVGVVVLPYQPVRERRLTDGDVVRERGRAREIARFAAGFESRQQRLAGMHVGILSAVRRQHRPVGVRFVGIQLRRWRPEALLHQIERLADPRACLVDARHCCVRVREQDERESVAMIGGVCDSRSVQQPGIAAGRRLPMALAQECQAVPYRLQVSRVAEPAIGHRVVEDEARAADQVARPRVVDRAVVAIEVIEAAVRIDGARMVERHGVADMIEEELGIAEVGHTVWSPSLSADGNSAQRQYGALG